MLATAIGVLVVAYAAPARATSCAIPGFSDAAFGTSKVDLGNWCSDSYDSLLGPYNSSTNSCQASGSTTSCNGGVGTNGITSGDISIGASGCALGDCQIGYGGSTSDISGGSRCNSESVEPSTVSFPVPTAPTLAACIWPGSGTAPSSCNYGDVTVSSTVQLQTGSYVFNNLTIKGGATLDVPATSGQVVLYLSGSVTISGSSSGFKNDTNLPGNLLIMCTNASTDPQSVTLNGGPTAQFAVYCPNDSITGNGSGDIYGTVVGSSVNMNGSGLIHYDSELAGLTTTSLTCTPHEVARSTPIIAQITKDTSGTFDAHTEVACSPTGAPCDAVVQGTFDAPPDPLMTITSAASVTSWTFPRITGHLRVKQDNTTNFAASGTDLTTNTDELFDAADHIPSTACASKAAPLGLDGSCRYIFTNGSKDASGVPIAPITTALTSTGLTSSPPVVQLLSGNASTIFSSVLSVVSGLTATNLTTIVSDILGAKLGGVDRSTVAVIEASTTVDYADQTRPKMIYFGAADGMLHAVCAEAGGKTTSNTTSVCPAAGAELWAFLPRVELPLIRLNQQRVDGSPHVMDEFGTVDCPGGQSHCWRTILTFQTGFANSLVSGSSGAAYALDVTDPANPTLLWERTKPLSPGSTDFGAGLTVTSGPVLEAGVQSYIAVLETSNGGTGGAGVVTTALDLTTGNTYWATPFAQVYSVAVPSTGVPGGAVGVDLAGNGYLTDVLVPDLQGRLWRIDASTGANQLGSSALFSFPYIAASGVSPGERHPIGFPPAIYSDGTSQYAAFTSGGYTDQSDSVWHAGYQYLVAVKIGTTAVSAASGSPGTCAGCKFYKALPNTNGQEYGWSQPLVLGNGTDDAVYATSDLADINSLGFANGTVVSASAHVTAINGESGATVTGYSTPIAVYTGASGIAAGSLQGDGSKILVVASNTKGQTVKATGQTTTGAAVGASGGHPLTLQTSPKVNRELWLRTE